MNSTKTVTPLSQRKAATKAAGHDAPRSNASKKAGKAKATAKKSTGSGPRPRLTTAWLAKDGKSDLQMGDEVKGPNGLTGIIKSRFTGKERQPWVALTVTGGEGYAATADGKPAKGKHIAADELTRTKNTKS